MTSDRYGSFDYSRLISWDDRLKRECGFLEGVLASAPSKKVLDVGSGTGEHARFLAGKGFDVLGVDNSPAMLEKARAAGGRFVQGDMREVTEAAGEERFGAALCLGNALPHLLEREDLARLAAGLRAVVVEGGVVVLQLLNYDRIEAKRERALPLSFLPDPDHPDATIVFLRAMELRPERRVTFMPTILRMRPDAEPPMELVASQRVEIRGWRAGEIESALRAAGFPSVELWGSYQKAPFEPAESRDVIVVAR